MTGVWSCLRELGRQLRHDGNVKERQEAWLRNCLARNCDTTYGRLFDFGQMVSSEEFRNCVPLVSYDDLASNIMQIESGESDILFAGRPLAFERTGGSTGGNKLIPYTASSLLDFRKAILPWLADASTSFNLEQGSAYWAISPATRGMEHTRGGIAVGLPDAAYLGEAALPAFAELSAVPPWVGGIPRVADWQLATLYWLVRREDMILISVWSPTFLLALLDGLLQRADELERLLSKGGRVMDKDLPSDIDAAARMSAYLKSGETNILWPSLKLVSCWADATSRPFFEALKRRLPHADFQGKGLLATEGVVTVPNGEGAPVLAADSGFYEFLDSRGESRLAHELGEGECYEVVMTTAGGLYRYRTGDAVVCEGHAGTIPRLRFMGRCGLVSDLVGEKLSEEFVASCLDGSRGFRMLLPVHEPSPGYVLVLDAADRDGSMDVAVMVEEKLRRNPQYAYARDIGQLAMLTPMFVIDPLGRYTERIMMRGVRLGDVKVPALRPEPDWLPVFSGGAI